MPYSLDEIYALRLEIPKGYKVDELPKSNRVNLADNMGYFEYLTGNEDGMVQLRTRIKINKAFFQPEDYEMLRAFFDLIVKKQTEQIVFKKL